MLNLVLISDFHFGSTNVLLDYFVSLPDLEDGFIEVQAQDTLKVEVQFDP